VDFWTYDENKWGDWTSFNFTEPHAKDTVGRTIHIDHHQLDTSLEKRRHSLRESDYHLCLKAQWAARGSFSLFHTLRVQSVTAEGQPLSFIQEDKNDDADFAVILPKPLAMGEKFSVTTTYGGKEAVSNEGGGNYFPIARHNWYPNSAGFSLGEYAFL